MKYRVSISLVLTLMLASLDWTDNKWKLIATVPVAAVNLNTPVGCDPKMGCSPDDPRSPDDCNTPTIISPPNSTALLNERPPLSWNAVKGVSSYSVRIKGLDTNSENWQRKNDAENPNSTSGEIKVDYPSDVKALQPGRTYQLTVEAMTESAEKRVATFKMLSQQDAQQVREIVEKTDKLNLTKEQKVLQHLYKAYMEKKLVAETREMLEELVKGGSQTAEVYQKLGDIYFKQGLFDLAKPQYETAARLARTTQNSQELAAALEKLDEISKMPKQCKDAP